MQLDNMIPNRILAPLERLVEGRLWLKVLLAMFLGIGVGIVLSPGTGWLSPSTSTTAASWLGLPGTLFIKLVQMVMIPMIVTSIMTGITSNGDNPALAKTGLRLGVYFLATTAVAISIGIVVAKVISPGQYFAIPAGIGTAVAAPPMPSLVDLPNRIMGVFPSNPLAAMVTGEMLEIVLFSIIMGVAVLKLDKEQSRLLESLLRAVQGICMTVVKWAMAVAPLAVFGMMAALVINTGVRSLLGLAAFIGSVILALSILLVFYAVLLKFLGGVSLRAFFRDVRDVQLLAFSMASSAAVMPLTMKTAEEKLHVDESVANLVVPIGATVNMDGTALFQCMATLFLSQIYGLDLGAVTLALLLVTIVAASVGTPAVPGGGIVVMASVLGSIGLPGEGVMILVGVDRILGMFRTAVNVTGDLTACVLFQKWLGPSISPTEDIDDVVAAAGSKPLESKGLA